MQTSKTPINPPYIAILAGIALPVSAFLLIMLLPELPPHRHLHPHLAPARHRGVSDMQFTPM